MTKQVQRRRGTSTQHTSFTGAEGEISVNTTNKSIHVHDGITAGGVEAARADLTNVSDANLNAALSGNTLSSLTITSVDINGGTIDGAVIGGSSAAAGTFTTVTASGDVTIADKIVHSGDTNTAIRFPAADTVTVETSGAERLRVTSAGDVLQGTTSAITGAGSVVSVNQVAGTTAASGRSAFVYSATNTAAPVYEMGKSANATVGSHTLVDDGETLGTLRWSGSDGTNFIRAAEIVGIVNGTPGTSDMPGALTFGTTADGGTAPTERMRINSSGNVGIGTTSPAAQLHVAGNTTTIVTLSSSSISGTTMTVGTASSNAIAVGNIVYGVGVAPITKIVSQDSGTPGGAGTYTVSVSQTVASGTMYTGPGAVATIRVANTDTSVVAGQPEGTIEFFGSDANTPGAGIGAYISAVSEDSSPDTALTFGTRDDAGGGVDANERMRITSTGNVGIGTNSPGGLGLTVAATPAVHLVLRALDNTSESRIWFGDPDSDIMGRIEYEHNNDAMAFWTASTERMRIDSSGNVGIGTNSPSSPLDIYASTSGTHLRLTYPAVRTWNVGTQSGGSFAIRDANAASDRMTITTAGNVGIGTSSPAELIHIAGGASAAYLKATNSAGTQGIEVGVSATGDGVVNVQDAKALRLFTTDTERMRIDSSGNLGLGVTPSAWNTSYKTLEIQGGSFTSSAGTNISLAMNAYVASGGSWTYKGSAGAMLYQQTSSSGHLWFTAPSGTAGNAITFTQAMTLDASGNFYVGTTSQSGGSNITFNQPANADMKIAASASTGTRASYQVFVNNTVTTVGTENSTGGSLASGTAAYSTVLANNGAYPISFATNNTERARISSVGFLGIGTSSPAVAVHVSGATTGAATIRTQASSGGAGQFQAQTDGSIFTMQAVSGGGLRFVQEDVAERARIDASGNLLVGTTGLGTGRLQVLSPSGTNDMALFRTSTSFGNVIFQNSSGTQVGYIQSSATATSYVTSSDYRLKENVQPMQNALDTVAQLNPVTYTWKADGSAGQGFIAHELQAVVPDCVTGEKDAVDAEGNPQYQGVDTSFLVATLVKAIQELKAEVDSLRAQLNP